MKMKNKLIKTLALLLACITIAGILASCDKGNGSTTTAAATTDAVTTSEVTTSVETTKGETDKTEVPSSAEVATEYTVVSTQMKVSGNVSFCFDWKTILGADYSKYNTTLQMLSFLLTLDAHDNCSIYPAGTTATAETDNSAFPKALGFSGTKTVKVGANATENTCDTAKAVISSYKTTDGGKTVYFINVSVNGTDGADEWTSNFDLGSDSSAIYSGALDAWNRNNAKGFDIAAGRVIAEIQDYTKTLEGFDGAKVIYCINGYSRGAAVANIIASKFKSDAFPASADSDCFAYTFATPRTTLDSSASSCNNIFNLINIDDMVTSLPPYSMGYVRYGQDIVFNLNAAGNEALKAQFKTLSGVAYNNAFLSAVVDAINSLCDSRDEYYSIPTEAGFINSSAYDTEAAASTQRASLVSFFTGLCPTDTDKYVYISPVTKNEATGKYEVSYSFAPAVFGKMLPTLMTASSGGGGAMSALSAVNYLNFGNYQPLCTSMISMFIGNSTGLANMHLPYAYLVYLNSLK